MTRSLGLIGLILLLVPTTGAGQSARGRPAAALQIDVPSPNPPTIHPELPQPRGPTDRQPVASRRLSLAEAEQIALNSNPALARASAELLAAEGHAFQAGLPPNPTIGYAGEEIGAAGLAGKQGIFVNQTFVRGHKLKLDRQVAFQNRIRAEENLHAQRLRVLTDVRIAFSDVLIAQEERALSRELLDTAQESSNVAKTRFDSEDVNRVDVLRSGIETQRAAIALANAENRHRAAWRELAAVLGTPKLSPVELAGNVEDLVCDHEWSGTLQRLLEASPELGAAYAEVERARWALRRSLVENVPNVELELGAAYDYETRDPIGSVQVGFPIPVFNRNQGRIREARQQVIAAEANYQRLELAVQQRLAQVFERYENARQQARRFREDILPAAEESLSLVRLGYSKGEFDYLALLNAQQTYAQSKLQSIGAQRELRRASIEIQGMLLSGSLQSDSR